MKTHAIAILLALAAALQEEPRPTPTAPSSAASTLPKPSGAASVGTRVVRLTDSKRPDPSRRGRPREVAVQLWYPAKPDATAALAAYVLDPKLLEAMVAARYFEQETSLLESWKRIVTDAHLDSPPASGDRFPLLVFSHGFGASRASYTSIAQELASHGYAVLTLDHPYGGLAVLSDGKVASTASTGKGEPNDATADEWAQDLSFVLNEIERRGSPLAKLDVAARIDLQRIGALGHSMGGTAALAATSHDDRIDAVASLDGPPIRRLTTERIHQPTLVLLSQPIYSDEDLVKLGRTREKWEAMGKERQAIWDSIRWATGRPSWIATIRGTGHMSFSDAPFVMPTTLTRFGGTLIAPARGFEITSAVLRAFFDAELRGAGSDRLESLASTYAELELRRAGK